MKRNPVARHVAPMVEVRIVRDQLLRPGVGPVKVVRVAQQRETAERADAAIEKRADMRWDEGEEIERVDDPLSSCDLANIVAIIYHGHACLPEIEHRADVPRIRLLGGARDAVVIALARFRPAFQRPASGQIAIAPVMRRGLVGRRIHPDAAPDEFGISDYSIIHIYFDPMIP